ncbi:MAG: MFS transporter [bacterium]
MDNNVENLTYNSATGYRAVLRNKNFLFLWLGQIFSQLGDRVTFVVFVAIIAKHFYMSASLQSGLYISFTIPAVLLTAIAGVFVDKWNKKHILISTNILRGLIIILLPIADKYLFGIYALAFLISSVTQFFVPAEAASIPTLVDKKQLIAANSLFTTTMMGSIIFGFALGDPLINIFGLKAVHWAVAGLFLISSFSLSFIKNNKHNEENEAHKSFKDFMDDLSQGIVYIKNTPIVLNAILKLSTLFSVIVMLSILAISISQHWLYPDNIALGAQKFVYIVAFSGVGMVLGSIAVGKLWRNIDKYLLIYRGFALIGLSLILLILTGLIPNESSITIPEKDLLFLHLEQINLTTRMIYAYFISALVGLGCSLVAIPVQTVLHSAVPEDLRGKVFGVQFTFLSTSSTLPVLVAAFMADALGIGVTLIIIGLPILLFGLFNLIKKHKSNELI